MRFGEKVMNVENVTKNLTENNNAFVTYTRI